MPTFRYRALTANGETIAGEIDADSPDGAVIRLQEAGQLPISVSSADRHWLNRVLLTEVSFGKRWPRRELGLSLGHLAVLLEAGIPLDRSLTLVSNLVPSAIGKRIWQDLWHRVRGGAALASAMAEQPKVWPNFIVGMIRAGESTGSLVPNLKRLSHYLGKTEAVRQKVKSALIYPTLLVLISIISIAFMITFVLPEFQVIFDNAGVQLPWLTEFMIDVGKILEQHFDVIIIVLLLVAVAWRHWREDPEFRALRDRLFLSLPGVADLVRKHETARFARALGTLLVSRLPLPSALALVQQISSNQLFVAATARLLETVRMGKSLSGTIKSDRIFTPLVTPFIELGEESGQLGEMLLKAADIMEDDLQTRIERFLTLLVPLLTIGLGLVIAGIIGSVLLAILGLNQLAA